MCGRVGHSATSSSMLSMQFLFMFRSVFARLFRRLLILKGIFGLLLGAVPSSVGSRKTWRELRNFMLAAGR